MRSWVLGEGAPQGQIRRSSPHCSIRRWLDRAIYATGWDGDVVITATKDGKYTVVTEH